MSDNESRITPARFVPTKAQTPAVATGLRKGAVITALALAVCAFVAWFLFTARAVYFDVTPEYAEVRVRAGLKLNLMDRYLLRPGRYELRIVAPGHHPLDESLEVGEQQNQHYSFTLERLPGHLRVTTTPADSARIFLDGEPRGETPTVVREISPGEYRLRVSADRYFPFEDTVVIEGLDREQEVSVELVPAWADLTFASDPAGAEVFVDDESLGQTPLEAAVLEGTHRVRIKRAGFKPWQEEIDVKANVPMQFTDIVLEPADALVFLASEPPRASVTVNGEYKGLTPLELAVEPERETTIRLFRQGYRPASRTISVASGSEQRLQVNLDAALTTVEFQVTPADAEVFIDGRPVGKGSQSLQLPARPHRVEIRREGYVDYQTTLTPHSGMAQQVKIAMKTLEQARQEQIKPLITTGAGQKLKLFRPTGFTMGASRREPGRRANETIRTVQLERPFYLGLHEVTNEEFRQFQKDHSSGTILGRSLDSARQPVVRVTWEQAARYCNWLSRQDSLAPFYVETDQGIGGVNPLANGYRLPTEAEWEWAARTVPNGPALKFPWGPEMPPPKNSGNYADASAGGMLAAIVPGYEDGHVVSAPAGSYGAGNRGLFDMGGNVAEWVHDFYDVAIGMAGGAEIDPLGPEQGEFHVIKGASWAHGTITELRLSYREYSAEAREDVGFRLARYLE